MGLPSTRGQELKLFASDRRLIFDWLPSTRGQELKPPATAACTPDFVALYARAGIETAEKALKERGSWLPSTRGQELKRVWNRFK